MLNSAVRMAVEIGDELIKVKKSLPHGEFGKWCDENIVVVPRHYQRYMELASFATRESLLEQPSIRQALNYIKQDEPKPEPSSFDKINKLATSAEKGLVRPF